MTGEELKKRIKTTGRSIAELARDLNVLPQSLSQALNAKDVKTGLVEDLAKVLGLPVSYFFGEEVKPAEQKAAEDNDKDREILYLRGQVAAYEKALGISRNTASEKANVG